MKSPESASNDAIAQLCPACGLCCNGVLFADVELQAGDSHQRLLELGLDLQRKGRKLAFSQPCACFDGNRCRVYADRPSRCRVFECRVLKRVQAGELPVASGLKLIAQAKHQVQAVSELVRRLGNSSEALPLSRRYAQIMAQPIDLAGDDQLVELRAKLMLEVASLMKRLHRDFLA